MSEDKIADIRTRQEAGKTELSLQSEVIDSLKYLHSLEQLHDKDCDWQTQLINVVWWALELVEKGEQSPSVAPKIWDAFIVGDFDTTLGIATDGARVLLTELIDDRATLLAEVERLRQTVQWYGDRAHALSGADNKYPFSDLFEDAGARALNALEGKK